MWKFTEHQKKHHFFRAMLTKIHPIKMNHIWIQISYSSPHEAHLKIQRVAFVKKEKNLVKLQRSLFKNPRNCLPRTSTKGCLFRTLIELYSISKADYVTTVLHTCQLFLFNREYSYFAPPKRRKRGIFTMCPYFCKNLSVVMYRKFRNIYSYLQRFSSHLSLFLRF